MSIAQEPPPTSNAPNAGASANKSAGRVSNTDIQLESLSKQLDLTAAQKQKIRPLLAHETERIHEVLSNGSLTQREARRRIAMIHTDTRARIGEVLTASQKSQWEPIRSEPARATASEGAAQPGMRLVGLQNSSNLN